MKTSKRGGARKGAGRKPIDDKRIPIRIFPQQSRVDMLKGEEETKFLCMQFIESQYQRRLLAVHQKRTK